MNFPSLFPRTFPMLAGRGCAYHEYGASAPTSGRSIAAATDAASVCKDAMFVQQAPLGGEASSSSCGSGRGLSASESDTSASSSSSNSAGGLAPQRAEGGGGGGDSDAAGAQPKAKKLKSLFGATAAKRIAMGGHIKRSLGGGPLQVWLTAPLFAASATNSSRSAIGASKSYRYSSFIYATK